MALSVDTLSQNGQSSRSTCEDNSRVKVLIIYTLTNATIANRVNHRYNENVVCV